MQLQDEMLERFAGILSHQAERTERNARQKRCGNQLKKADDSQTQRNGFYGTHRFI